METNNVRVRQPRTWGEFWQACGYGALGSWAAIFYFFPPLAFINALDASTRVWWLLAVLLGSLLAMIGLITRLDIKMELPGVIISLLGPFAYSASQVYYIVYPQEQGYGMVGGGAAPSNRYALVVYALLPGILLLPRLWTLRRQALQAKASRQTKAASESALQQMRDAITARSQPAEPPCLPEPSDIFTSGTLRLRKPKDIIRDAEQTLREASE